MPPRAHRRFHGHCHPPLGGRRFHPVVAPVWKPFAPPRQVLVIDPPCVIDTSCHVDSDIHCHPRSGWALLAAFITGSAFIASLAVFCALCDNRFAYGASNTSMINTAKAFVIATAALLAASIVAAIVMQFLPDKQKSNNANAGSQQPEATTIDSATSRAHNNTDDQEQKKSNIENQTPDDLLESVHVDEMTGCQNPMHQPTERRNSI